MGLFGCKEDTHHVKVSHQRAAGELFRDAAQNEEARKIPLKTVFCAFVARREQMRCNWAIGQLPNWSAAQFVVLGMARTTGELF